MRIIFLILPTILSCFSAYNRTSADEANAQRYGTGATGNTFVAQDGGSALIAAIPALYRQIDNARNRSEKQAHCKNLLRRLSNEAGPAYEWQEYYSRCQ